MIKKKEKAQGLISKQKNDQSLEKILSHPVVQDMRARLETMQQMLHSLPEAIGRSVEEAMRRVPEGAAGPPVPLIEPKTIEIHKQKIVLDGKSFVLPTIPRAEAPREITKESVT